MINSITIKKEYFKNCLDLINTEEGVMPVRFTQAQLDVYAQKENYYIRSYCPAGICLDIITDSEVINMDYMIKGKTRNYIFFDVYLNGVFVDSIGSKPIEANEGSFSYTVPDAGRALNRLTVYLPHNVELFIKNIEITEGASIKEAAPSYEKNILCLGDSITQGMDALHPSTIYAVQLSRFLGMNLLNQGIGGYVFNEKSLDMDLPYKPDIVTVAYGTNDWNAAESMDQLILNCSDYVNKLVKCFPGAKIFVITPIWRKVGNEVRKTGTLHEVCDAIDKICREYPEITVIKGYEIAPHIPMYYADGTHPTDEGFMHMAINIAKRICEAK